MTDARAAIAAYDALLARERFAEAGGCLYEALAAAGSENDTGAEISLWNEIMGFERQYGEKSRAEAAADRALGLLKTTDLENAKPAAMVYLNAATVKKACGKNGEAAALYETAEARFLRYYPAGAKEFAGLYNNIAALYLDTGAYEKAEYYYTRARDLLRRHGDVCDLAVTYCNLAQLFWRMDPCSPRIEENMDAALRTLSRPEAPRNAYYYYTCRKCAGAAEALGFFAAAESLTEGADRFYAGN